jgi:large subunit ribosomal protein L4
MEIKSIQPRNLGYYPPQLKPKQIWLENLNTVEEEKLAILDLHPEIFGVYPRTDIIAQNIKWQTLYGRVVSNNVHTKIF